METTNLFRKELETLINIHSKENGSDTPDWILAEFLNNCLTLFDDITIKRDIWYGKIQSPEKCKDIR